MTAAQQSNKPKQTQNDDRHATHYSRGKPSRCARTDLERTTGYDDGIRTRTLDVHIRRLRKQLGSYSQKYIETILGLSPTKSRRGQPYFLTSTTGDCSEPTTCPKNSRTRPYSAAGTVVAFTSSDRVKRSIPPLTA